MVNDILVYLVGALSMFFGGFCAGVWVTFTFDTHFIKKHDEYGNPDYSHFTLEEFEKNPDLFLSSAETLNKQPIKPKREI